MLLSIFIFRTLTPTQHITPILHGTSKTRYPIFVYMDPSLATTTRTIPFRNHTTTDGRAVGQQKTQNRISYSRWAFNNACQVGRSWKGQPNLILLHIPFLRDETDIWYILQLSSAISQTKKEKNGTSAFLKKVHRLLFFNPETKKSMYYICILNVYIHV